MQLISDLKIVNHTELDIPMLVMSFNTGDEILYNISCLYPQDKVKDIVTSDINEEPIRTLDLSKEENTYFRHFKNKWYKVLCIATHIYTQERFVVYQALYDDNKLYARPYNMFVSEIDRETKNGAYKDVPETYRFTEYSQVKECDKTLEELIQLYNNRKKDQ